MTPEKMKMEYDKDVDAAYIYLQYPIAPGEAKHTVEINENIFLDYDDQGKLIGVEILEASKVLRKEMIPEQKKRA
ncbi:DUF2283 domain-containing protein [Candidatus Woesearchaeota archaeon]|nr:DUF2283 domain-containing protein [Candidatus Woesearchaeota archaeon]